MKTHHALLLACVLMLAGTVGAGPIYVPGLVPDWNQPYRYNAPGGPGPDPNVPPPPDPWDAWCAPASAANLVGHWQDVYGRPVADGVAFPGSPAWPATNWHDYEADGFARPPAGGAVPAQPTDIGYYMDTNNMGMFIAPGNPAHTGTYLKDIDTGLLTHFSLVHPAGNWTTGTQGRGFAAGLASNGAPAAMHANAAAASAEIVGEINAGRTMIVCWTHWRLVPTGQQVGGGGQGENQFAAGLYEFGQTGTDPWGNDEEWNYREDGLNLGHAVTVVGYMTANDPLNPFPGTNWVIVHDNCLGTPRNVGVPLTAATFNIWVANTNAVPEPSSVVALALAGLVVIASRRR